jgi:CRP-like cAMP-binding protein
MTLPQTADGFQLMGEGEEFKELISEMIAGTNLFSSLPWDEVQVLANYLQGYRIASGTIIFREGEAGSFMCLLVQGEVEIYKADTGGWLRELVTIKRGSTIGEMSLIDYEPRSATCIAKEDSLVLILSRQNYESILKEHPAVAVQLVCRIAKLLSQRLRAQNGQMVDFIGGYYPFYE